MTTVSISRARSLASSTVARRALSLAVSSSMTTPMNSVLREGRVSKQIIHFQQQCAVAKSSNSHKQCDMCVPFHNQTLSVGIVRRDMG